MNLLLYYLASDMWWLFDEERDGAAYAESLIDDLAEAHPCVLVADCGNDCASEQLIPLSGRVCGDRVAAILRRAFVPRKLPLFLFASPSRHRFPVGIRFWSSALRLLLMPSPF